MKSVMMLEGGSYRGIYTSGILDVFMACHILNQTDYLN